MSKNIQILKFILVIFLGWKIIISFIAFFGLGVFPESLPESQIDWAHSTTDYWMRWANWDGGHFRGIAENGYIPFQVVFFPLYPLLIKGLMFLQIPSLWGGILISNLSIIGALFYLYRLVNLDFEESVAKKTIFITLAFPTAFYFNAVYSESLFLFLTVAAFYHCRQKQWFIALILASLSAATRLAGLVVILSISLEYFLKTTNLPTIKEYWSEFLNRIASYSLLLAFCLNVFQGSLIDNEFFMLAGLSSTIVIFLTAFSLILFFVYILKFLVKYLDYKKLLTRPSLFILFSFLPFLGFCIFLYFTQNHFLAFIKHEQQWARHLTLPWIAPVNYFRSLMSENLFQIGKTDQLLIEFLFFAMYVILLIISYLKLRLSYTIYFALSLLIPISTGTLQAIHRYGLVIFPVFILLALIKNETYSQLWMYFSLTLLGVLTVLFINSYWVS